MCKGRLAPACQQEEKVHHVWQPIQAESVEQRYCLLHSLYSIMRCTNQPEEP